MALATAVKGGRRPSQTITWRREGGGVEPLTGATITGWLRGHNSRATRPIAGALVVVDGARGQFRWDYAAGDVAEAGTFDVQFTASFEGGASPAKTFVGEWAVEESLNGE